MQLMKQAYALFPKKKKKLEGVFCLMFKKVKYFIKLSMQVNFLSVFYDRTMDDLIALKLYL